MGFLQIRVAEEVRLWAGRWAVPVRGQLCPKIGTGTHMDSMEKQSKISFFLARQVGWAQSAYL